MLKDKLYGKNSSMEFEMSEEAMTAEDLQYIKKMHREIMDMSDENGDDMMHGRLLAMSESNDINQILQNMDPE